MIIPKKLFYAVEAVLYIAYNAGKGPISSRGIALKQGLPARYLEQLMQKLVRGGILRGVRGPHGGYLLARERRRITVGDICAVLAEDKEEAEVVAAATPLGRAVVQPICAGAQAKAMDYLREVNLSELCDQALALHIRKESDEKMDFEI